MHMDTYNGELIAENTSLWIHEYSSTVTLDGSTQSTYFVPIYSSLAIRSEDSSTALVIEGTVLVPCSLSAVIHTSSSDDATEYQISQADGDENSLSLFMTSDLLQNETDEISVSLKYASSTDPVDREFITTPQLSVHTSPPSSASPLLSTGLIIIISASSSSFLILLALIIIVVVCIHKRSQAKLLNSDTDSSGVYTSLSLTGSGETEKTPFQLSDDQDPTVEF